MMNLADEFSRWLNFGLVFDWCIVFALICFLVSGAVFVWVLIKVEKKYDEYFSRFDKSQL